jgi:hypothetical protein
MVYDVEQARESPIMKVATFVLRLHEYPILAYENAREIHRLVNTIRRAVCLETIDAYFRRRVEIPAGLGP